MTNTFLKSTTAIVLSLSLAVPSVAMAQTAAELEAALGVSTQGLSEEELDVLRKQLADQLAAQAQGTQPPAAEEAAPEAQPEAQEAQTETQPVTEAPAETAPAQAETAPAPAEAPAATTEAPAATTEAPAATTEAPAEAPAATADAPAEQPAQTTEQPAVTTEAPTDAPAAQPEAQPQGDTAAASAESAETAPADSAPAATTEQPVVTETAPAQQPATTAETTTQAPAAAAPAATAETTTTQPAADSNALQAQVDELQKKLDALASETAEQTAARQAETQAAEAQAQTSSMAATETGTADAQVVEQTVTEETARSSSEEFTTKANAAAAPAPKKDGLDTLGKIALFGLGALAVGQILKNGSQVVSNSGDRVVVQQQDGSYRVYKNDDVLINQPGTDVKTYAYADGSTKTVATRDNGVQIETIRAADGTVLRRTRILNDGTRVVLFDDTRATEAVRVNELPQVTSSRNTVNIRQAEEDELRRALQAQLPTSVDRRFSLSQVRNINAVRKLVPEVGVDNITFETGSSVIRPEQARELSQLGSLMREVIADNPGEVFLIEGHTDAVGSASYNLALSDRRAESVALALTEYFDVPPENMVVQGYGEYDLKIRTNDAERENRRAAVRRITDLLAN